ncbi:ABC transporter ATP-binding protein [Bacillus sp. FJAT-49711]|uniref:ABC transporter ATP-binding protein n=1 Tax=Bacillus sp. FJAT-49711 TaxID=2833585 RepID=UPI001BC9B00C|nr:ABC transporter ATP-binding protein [Bacillus sp. FJAT-49711]MBS4219101.1 ABC transporter ATP-binding protein [Bacillus sp. FJAT-49711]
MTTTYRLRVEEINKVFTSRKSFKKTHFQAVQDVSFNLKDKEVLAIVGESGSGKSTTARILTNLIKPTSGEIYYDGISIKDKKFQRVLPERVQMIFQDPFAALNPHHSIGYAIGRPLQLRGKSEGSIRKKVLELLTQVGLTPAEDFIDKYPYQISGGQKQRVIIARVLGLEPEIIVADEPTSMLDVSIGIEIMNLLLDLRDNRNLSFILITHNLGSARYMADRIMVMYAGEIVEIGDSEEVINDPKHPYTKLLLQSSPDPWKENNTLIEAIEPSKTALPKMGCKFQNRCPFATEECRKSSIPFYSLSNERQVRCNLYN